MKLVKTITALFCAFVLSGLVGFADVPQSLPIGSLSALRGYAIEQASSADASVSSLSSVQYKYVWQDWSSTKLGSELLAVISSLDLKGFSVENPKDPLYLYVDVSNRTGDRLFSASNVIQPVTSGIAWALPPTAGNIKLVLADTVPIAFEGLYGAGLRYKDPSGRTFQFEDIQVRDGKVYFPKALAGNPSVTLWLYVNVNDGSSKTFVYSPKDNGKIVDPTVLNVTLSPSIEGYAPFQDANPALFVPSAGGVGINPTVELVLTSGRSVIVSAVTTELRQATAFWVRARGDVRPTRYSAGGGSAMITLPAGVYYITPEWNPSEFKDAAQTYTPYQPYYGGGEKG